MLKSPCGEFCQRVSLDIGLIFRKGLFGLIRLDLILASQARSRLSPTAGPGYGPDTWRAAMQQDGWVQF
jgi:hypothetical protein